MTPDAIRGRLARKMADTAPELAPSLVLGGRKRLSPKLWRFSLADGSDFSFAYAGTGSNDIFDSYYRISHGGVTLELYDGDHDVAQYTEIRFHGDLLLDAVQGPGVEREETHHEPRAAAWADLLLEACGLPGGADSFSQFCYEVLAAPGPSFARIYRLEP
jgi:hypothetical protein